MSEKNYQPRVKLYLEETGDLVGEFKTVREAYEAMLDGVKYEIVDNRRRYPMDDDNQDNQKNVCKKS